MSRRVLVPLLAVLTAFLVLGSLLVPAGTAQAAPRKKPVITKISARSGPLTPIRVTIKGRHFKGVQKVMFGPKAGTRLRTVSPRKVTVMTPRATTPGKVNVRIKTRAGWSKVTRKTVFTYKAPATVAPEVMGLSPTSGPVAGGTTVTISGKGFTAGATVEFGDVPATDVAVAGPGELTAVAPPNLDGEVPVTVTTAAGEGSTAPGAGYTYVFPAEADTTSVGPSTGTFVADAVAWVTGGPQDPDAGEPDTPWIVGLANGVTPPAVDQHLVVPPGTPGYRAGLVGTVTEVALQTDLTHAVTVAPTPLEEALDDLSVHYSGDVGEEEPDLARTTTERQSRATLATTRSVEFSGIGPSKFLCEDENGSSASFAGEVGFRLDNIRSDFYFDSGGWSDAQVSAWVRADVVVHGKVSASGKMTCELKPQWQNAIRKVLPLGTTGATLSIAPTATFSISASGTLRLQHTTGRMVGVAKLGDNPLRTYNISTDRGFSASGSAALTASIRAGLSVQFGMLDRVGVEGKVMLRGDASVTLQAPPPQACVQMSFNLDISLGVFLDLWVRRWERDLVDHTVPIGSRRVCSAVEDDELGGDPEIATARLPRALNGRSYSAFLEVADGRDGTWSAPGGLPAGLTLDPSTGEVRGVPGAQVGDYALTFRFVDGSGASVQAVVWLYVGPDVLAGGDVQVTLLWSSPADLDLYVTDPNGDTVYYGNPTSPSGGWLDHDSNAACSENLSSPVENIAWPDEQAPEGTYSAWVDVYDTCGTSNLSWRLIVRVDGAVVVDTTGNGNSSPVPFSRGSVSPRLQVPPTFEGREKKAVR